MRPWYPSDRRDAPAGDPIVRAIRREADGDEPDPQFRNRLRGSLLSHHVAVREGHPLPVLRASMTPIGRGVLVASVLLAVGVTGVGAASQQAIPDDPLYAVKLRIEELRILAAPADLRDDLVAMSLEARLSEVEVAVARGRWHAAHEAAVLVTQTEAELARLGGPPPVVADHIAQHLASLAGLLAATPSGRSEAAQDISAARAAIRAANDRAGAAAGTHGHGNGNGGAGATGNNGNGTNNGNNGNGGGGGSSSAPAPSPTARPTPKGNGPKASPPGGASSAPHPTPRASKAPQGSPASS